MRIGIITFTYGDNYGQRLQNLATQEFVKQYFEEVFTIRQVEPCTAKMKRIIKNKLDGIFRGDPACDKRHFAFMEFDKRYINYYNIPISVKNANKFPDEEFDCFVAGSDQIWSPYSDDVNETMFLRFTERHKRIALSPSIATDDIPIEKQAEFEKYFNGFDRLSVREDKGAELIYDICGRNAEVLIDPTLMYGTEFWSKYSNEPPFELPENYAVCYMLGITRDLACIQKICGQADLKIVNLLAEHRYLSTGPAEFLYIIKNAKLVVTDSYHGTIFSLLFHRPFIVCERKGSSINMNSRFDTLFKKLEITVRAINESNLKKVQKIDFETVEEKLRAERKKFAEYFEGCLVHN